MYDFPARCQEATPHGRHTIPGYAEFADAWWCPGYVAPGPQYDPGHRSGWCLASSSLRADHDFYARGYSCACGAFTGRA